MLENVKFFFAKQYSKTFSKASHVLVLGTDGVDITTEAIYEVLNKKLPTLRGESSNISDNLMTSLFLQTSPGIKKVVLGVRNQSLDKLFDYSNLIHVNCVVVVNIDQSSFSIHDQLNQTIDKYAKIINGLPKEATIILNWDSLLVKKLAEKINFEPIFFGSDQSKCHIWIGNIRLSNFRLNFEMNFGVERVAVSSRFLMGNQLYSLLAAAAIGVNEGQNLIGIKKVLEKIEPGKDESKVVYGFNDSIIIDDTCTATLASVEESLDSLNLVTARRRILVLGELNKDSDTSVNTYKQIAQKIHKDRVDLVFLGTGDLKIVAEELLDMGFIENRLQYNLQNPQIVSQLLKVISRGDVVLVKGSISNRMDEIVKKITKIKR